MKSFLLSAHPMNDWIDTPIEKNTEKLFSLAVEYWGDQVIVNTFGGKKNG